MTRATLTRLEIVIVKRSDDAEKAINAGKTTRDEKNRRFAIMALRHMFERSRASQDRGKRLRSRYRSLVRVLLLIEPAPKFSGTSPTRRAQNVSAPARMKTQPAREVTSGVDEAYFRF